MIINSQYEVKKDSKALSSYYLESRSRVGLSYDLREGLPSLWKSASTGTSTKFRKANRK